MLFRSLDAIRALRSGTGVVTLTRREIEVLRVVAKGLPNGRIATALHISQSTVATHIRRIFAKTGVTNRTQAAAFARRAGLLDRE